MVLQALFQAVAAQCTVCKRLSRPNQGSSVSNKHRQQQKQQQQQQKPLDQTLDVLDMEKPSLLCVTLENYKLWSS